MSFLDNLENNLKALENAAERDPAEIARRQQAAEQAKAAALAIAPLPKYRTPVSYTHLTLPTTPLV